MESRPAALAPGLTHAQSVRVTEGMTPAHLRGEPIRVLATPEMVRLVEQTAIQAVQSLLARARPPWEPGSTSPTSPAPRRA